MNSHVNSVVHDRTSRESVKFTLSWTIENLGTLQSKTEDMFSHGITMEELGMESDYQGRWRIVVIPCHSVKENDTDVKYMTVHLRLTDTDAQARGYTEKGKQVDFEFNARVTTGRTDKVSVWNYSKYFHYVFTPEKIAVGWNKAIAHSLLFGSNMVPGLLKDDCITVTMDIVMHKEPTTLRASNAGLGGSFKRCRNFTERLDALLNSEEHKKSTDLVIRSSDGKEFHLHRLLLIAHSPVFSAMLSHDSKEKQTSRCEPEDVDGESVEVLLDFLYGCKTAKITGRNAEKALIMADKYQMLDLRDVCEEMLVGNVTAGKAVHYLELATQRGLGLLREAALDVIHRNVKPILKNDALQIMETDSELFQIIMEYCAKRGRAEGVS